MRLGLVSTSVAFFHSHLWIILPIIYCLRLSCSGWISQSSHYSEYTVSILTLCIKSCHAVNATVK